MKKIAVYPGSFNPFTVGHLYILTQTIKLFGNVIVLKGFNPDKAIEEAMTELDNFDYLKAKLKENAIKVDSFTGYLTDYASRLEDEGYDVTIVKGLRDAKDFDYEQSQLRVMEDMMPNLKIVYIPGSRKYEHVSSSLCRQLEKIKKGSSKIYTI